jgi:hypothetical protein
MKRFLMCEKTLFDLPKLIFDLRSDQAMLKLGRVTKQIIRVGH